MLVRPTILTTTAALAMVTLLTVGPTSPVGAQASKQSRECTIENVAIYEERVAIQCDVKGGKKTPIKYYAVASDSKIASMVAQLALNSMRRKVKIYFIDDASLNPPGCNEAVCRKLEGIVALED